MLSDIENCVGGELKKAREAEEAYNNLLAQVNQTYGFIDRATENFKESISLVIKGRM